MVSDHKFRCLVETDAKAIIDRQETDSVEIIDEIRYVLRTCDLTNSGIETGFTVSNSSINRLDDDIEYIYKYKN